MISEPKINSNSDFLPYTIRKADQSDFVDIKSLIREVQINPMGLKWQNFLIAVDAQGNLIGCGQIKTHQDGSNELASIAVVESWRRRGVARNIILHLLGNYTGVLFLTCRDTLEDFYLQFGFRKIYYDEMPRYFQRIWRIAGLINRIGAVRGSLLVMRRDPIPAP